MSDLQWVVDGYTLMFAALLLSGGALGHRLGARRVFQLGLALFVLASAGCAAAPTVTVLILARLVQGVGAALTVPASLSLLSAAYPEVAARARAVGVWGGIAGVAAAAGPVIGGVLVTVASWRLVFVVNIPIGLAGMALTARHVPAPAVRPRALDPTAQGTGVLALAALTVALIEGGHTGWTSALVLAGFAVFVAALAVFLALERQVADPMLPLGLFRGTTFTGGTVVGLLINLGFYGQLFVINLYFQQILGYSALRTGLALLPEAGVVSVASLLSGRFTARAGGPRRTMLVGLVVGGAGLLGLVVAGSNTPYPVLVVPLVAAGFGMAFTMPAATSAVGDGAPGERAGIASGVINAARQVGGVTGVGLLGDLVGGGAFVPGLHVAVAIAGAAFVAGAVLTVLLVQPASSAYSGR